MEEPLLPGAKKIGGHVTSSSCPGTGLHARELHRTLEKEDPSTYALLSNMLAGRHNWDCAGRARHLMLDTEVLKLPGST
jgi:hypothetical protein